MACSFKDFRTTAEDPVPDSQWTSFCRDCWPTGAPFEKGGDAEVLEDEDQVPEENDEDIFDDGSTSTTQSASEDSA